MPSFAAVAVYTCREGCVTISSARHRNDGPEQSILLEYCKMLEREGAGRQEQAEDAAMPAQRMVQ